MGERESSSLTTTRRRISRRRRSGKPKSTSLWKSISNYGRGGGERGTTLTIAVLLLMTQIECTLCILNNEHARKDVTNDPDFNCGWLGGNSAKLECNCITGNEEFIIGEKSIPGYDLYSINITNCGKIVLDSNAISSMRNLRLLVLQNIRSLTLNAESVHWKGFVKAADQIIEWDPNIPSLEVLLINTTVDRIANNAIKGRIKRLEVLGSTLRHVSRFAVSSLEQNLLILFDGVQFEHLEPHSFKKFSTESLIIKNSVFSESLPSGTFYDLTVKQQFLLQNVTALETFKPAAFMVNDPYKFELSQSTVNRLSGEAFRVRTRGSVVVRDNLFNSTATGAFRAITLNKEDMRSDHETILFERNVFNRLSRDSLAVDGDSFRPQFVNLQVSEECECENLARYFRSGENTLELSCLIGDQWVTVDQFQRTQCSLLDTSSGVAYIIAGVCALALLIAILALVYYFKRIDRSQSYGNNNEKDGKVSMIVPDGRTYRETELHVIVERADLLTTDL